jgi:hypothetical protein
MMFLFSFVFYNGRSIIVNFLHDFIMWCICYLQTSPVALTTVMFSVFFLKKGFEMWYIVLLTIDKFNSIKTVMDENK